MDMKFEELNQEERKEYINKLYDDLRNFIDEMAVKTNNVNKLKSNMSFEEYRLFVENIAKQLGKKEELDEMVEYIDIVNSIKDRL